MAKLATRTLYRRRDTTGRPIRGGAGGFHYPQKPGRTNNLGTTPDMDKLLAQTATSQPRALQLVRERNERRSLARRALDKLTRRAA